MQLDDSTVYLKQSPSIRKPGREVVPVTQAGAVTLIEGAKSGESQFSSEDRDKSPLEILKGNIDLRRANPREINEFSMDLYAAGLLNYEEYSALAFQAELQPDFNKTIGALTGKMAAPALPRDYVQIWEERVNFHNKHSAEDPAVVQQTKRISELLKHLDSPGLNIST